MLYKLTDENGQTRHKTQWGENISHTATGTGAELCSNGVIHAYESPLVAAFIYPIHVEFNNPILWEAEGEVIARDWSKCGCKTLTTLKQIPLPEISTEQRIAIAIRCAQLAYKDDPAWDTWASKWLSGEDRSGESAKAAWDASAASAAADADAAYAANAAAYAAYAAYSARSARAAARAADDASAAADATAAAYAAADAAADAADAYYAARAADYASRAAATYAQFDLAGIIEKVLVKNDAL